MPQTKKTKIENPFKQVDSTQSWFEQDKDYMFLKRISKNNFYQSNHLQSSVYMTLQNSILKALNYFSKHAIIAGLALALSLGSISAAAAQVFAPEQYKPATLLKLNKQTTQPPATQFVDETILVAPEIQDTETTGDSAAQVSNPEKKEAVSSTITGMVFAVANGSTDKGVNVRKQPCGEISGSLRVWGSSGMSMGESVKATCQGKEYTWLKVKWSDGVEGWTITDYLSTTEPAREPTGYDKWADEKVAKKMEFRSCPSFSLAVNPDFETYYLKNGDMRGWEGSNRSCSYDLYRKNLYYFAVTSFDIRGNIKNVDDQDRYLRDNSSYSFMVNGNRTEINKDQLPATLDSRTRDSIEGKIFKYRRQWNNENTEYFDVYMFQVGKQILYITGDFHYADGGIRRVGTEEASLGLFHKY
jgi:hypothetical protein